MEKVPDEVREWLKFVESDPFYEIKTPDLSSIEGVEIKTGVVGEKLTKDIEDFVKEHTKKITSS